MWDRDSAVGIATRYGLKGLGFVPPWGQEIFSIPFQTGPWAPRAPLCWVGGIFFGGTAAGEWH
jgi:hypothetical protein